MHGPLAVKNFLAYSLRRLGTDHIDIYRPSRLDPHVPIEDTIGALADMVKARLCAAHRPFGSRRRNHPPRRRRASDQRSPDRILADLARYRGEILPTCRELGIGITAYGVLSRGLISGHWTKSREDEHDFRGNEPALPGGESRSEPRSGRDAATHRRGHGRVSGAGRHRLGRCART